MNIINELSNIKNAINEMKVPGNVASQMWMNQVDKDWLKTKLVPKPLLGVDSLFGINLYVDDSIPNNMVKVVNSNGHIEYIQLREDYKSKASKILFRKEHYGIKCV
jgi:hypothetical protein